MNTHARETSTNATAELVRVSDSPSGVRTISMCDPLDRNALVEGLRNRIRTALDDAYRDPGVRSLMIAGAGKNFSVGGDLSHVAELSAGQASHAVMKAVGELAQFMRTGPKPVVAAVTGHCIGAGAGLALLCDTIVMGQSASMGFPFLRIGLVPDFGLSYTLAERIGHPAARQALLFAKTFKAQEAVSIGLVDEVVEDDVVHTRALALATMLAEFPAYAMTLARQMLRDGSTLEASLQREAVNQAICFGSDDVKEGIAAFKEKRKADFIRARRPAGSA